jgi:hypothetical protein
MIVCTPPPVILLLKVPYDLSIIHKISETSPYSTKMHDATGCIGLTLLQKCIVVVRQLAYGMVADTIDEYLKLGKTTTLECLKYCCAGII